MMLTLIQHPTTNWSHLWRPQRNRPAAKGEIKKKIHTATFSLRKIAIVRKRPSKYGSAGKDSIGRVE